MLNEYFYHKIIRKTVTSFGTLFNNIQIKTYNPDGSVVKQEKVPLAYGPIQKFLARLQQAPDIDKQFTISVPRISFEMTGISYDGGRKVPPTQYYRSSNPDDADQTRKQYMPVPYNVDFELGIIAKTQDDSLQILEQILPYFQPQFSITVDMIPEMGEKRDVQIVLNNINFNDDYEGDYTSRRIITYTLSFTCKTYIYGPLAASDVIKKSIADINIGDRTTNARVLTYEVTPKALTDQNNDGVINSVDDSLLTADDDFGFNEGITYYGP